MFSNNRNQTVSFVAQLDNNVDELINKKLEGDGIPLLALRDNVLAPGTVVPISVGRPISRHVVESAEKNGTLFVVVPQLKPDTELPVSGDLYSIGTMATLVHMMKDQDGNYNALLQGLNRVKISDVRLAGVGKNTQLLATVQNFPYEPVDKEDMMEYETIVQMVRDHYLELDRMVDNMPGEMV